MSRHDTQYVGDSIAALHASSVELQARLERFGPGQPKEVRQHLSEALKQIDKAVHELRQATRLKGNERPSYAAT